MVFGVLTELLLADFISSWLLLALLEQLEFDICDWNNLSRAKFITSNNHRRCFQAAFKLVSSVSTESNRCFAASRSDELHACLIEYRASSESSCTTLESRAYKSNVSARYVPKCIISNTWTLSGTSLIRCRLTGDWLPSPTAQATSAGGTIIMILTSWSTSITSLVYTRCAVRLSFGIWTSENSWFVATLNCEAKLRHLYSLRVPAPCWSHSHSSLKKKKKKHTKNAFNYDRCQIKKICSVKN